MKHATSTHPLRSLSVLFALALCAKSAFGITDAAKFPFRKGINLSKLESWTDTTAGYLGEDSTYTEIKSKGFDHVRFPVYFKNYYDSGSQTLKSNISVIDGVLDKCEANGLYVFLDFHGWSSINTTNGTDRADFLKIWDLVADRYRNRSDYVIFELINEPHTTEGGNLDAANLNALQAEVLPIIRRTNPDRLVLLAAAEWNGPWKLSELTIPDNPGPIGVVCHTYGPLAFTHQGATWGGFSTDHVAFTSADKTATGTKDLDDAFRYIDDFQEKTGVPVVMNEFGVNKQNSKATDAETLDWTSYVARNCESNGIAWTWWEYNKGFGAYYQNNWWSGYQWRAPVMDGLFPAEPAGNAYSDSFIAADYAKTMTISFTGYAGTSPLPDFPALVKLSTAIPGFDYADFQRTGGDDLRFTDANGNLLPHEIDTWNSNGVSTVWVKVPSLTAATTIHAHYGCSLPVAVDSSAVWDSDYVGVWHLGEGGLPLRESSRSSTDFTKQNGSGIKYAQSGAVGGSVDFGATGNGRMLTAQDCDALDGFTACTVEAWTYQTSNTTAAVLSKRYAYNKNLSYFLYHNGTKTQFNVAASDTTSGSSAQLAPPLNQWTHQVYTFDAGTIRGYMNGAKAGTDKTLSFSKINASNGYLHLGNFCRDGAWNADTRNFPGKIDEVRISKCVRSADWLQATHDTVENASFATYAVDGPEPPPEPSFSLSAAAEPGFAWTNGTATVSVAVTNGVAVPVGAVVRMTVSDASGAVLGTADHAWMGDGDYAFDTADAVSGTALSGYDYTLSFAVVDGSGAPVSGDAAACGLRLGSAASWFSADPATGEVAGGAWEAVPNVSEGTWTISDGAAFAAFENRTGLVRCDVELPVSTTASSSDLPSALAFAAANGERAGLAPVDDGGDIVWHGLVLENGALAWKALQGGGGLQSAVPFIPIAMELDLADPSAPRVSYLVGGERLRDASGAEWFPAPGTAAAAEGVVDIHGSGSVGAFAGSVIDKAVAETADGTRHATLAEALAAGDVTLLTNVEWPEGAPVGTTAIDRDGHVLLQGGVAVEGSSVVVTAGPVAIAGEGTLRVTFGKLASVGVATAGRTPAQIAADLAAAGANGIPRWQSLVLGLDAADPNARPLADIAVDSASGAVSVSDAGLAVDESTGATVTYQVREIPDLADPSADVPVGDPASPGTPVALPMGDAAARFFRIQVRIALP